MTQLTEKTGSIFETYAQAIGHGVNTHGVMGSGIAVQFKQRFPQMYEEYRRRCFAGELQAGGVYPYDAGPGQGGKHLFVYNIASQAAPGANATYQWLLMGVAAALRDADEKGIKTLALPRIGAGVGGLEWSRVRRVLEALAESFDCDIEVWSLPEVQ